MTTERGQDKVPLRDHLEVVATERLRRFEDLWTSHVRVHDQEAISREEAARRIDARLETLNELRADVVTDRGRLVLRETFDARLEAVDARIDALHEQVVEWRGREKGLSLSASILVGAVGLIGAILAIYFALA